MPPTASMTRKQLVKQVALRALLIEQENGVKVARTDEPAATQLLEALDIGAREFMRAHDWSFLTETVTLTLGTADALTPQNINNDPRRYRLPAYVESLPKERCDFMGPDSTQGGGPVAIRPFDFVAGMAFRDPTAVGHPVCVAAEFRSSLGRGLGENGGMELRVWPKPDQAYTLEFRARVGYVALVDDNQVGQWPAVHDLTVIDYAVAALFDMDKDKGDPEQGRAYTAAVAKAAASLALSIERDNEDYRPQELGGAFEADAMPAANMAVIRDLTTGEVIVRRAVYG